MNKTLDDLRKEIDAADEELLHALAKRMDVVREVGKHKQQQQIEPLDEKRWQNVLQNITEKANKQNIPEDLIHTIYEAIHQSALKLENEYE